MAIATLEARTAMREEAENTTGEAAETATVGVGDTTEVAAKIGIVEVEEDMRKVVEESAITERGVGMTGAAMIGEVAVVMTGVVAVGTTHDQVAAAVEDMKEGVATVEGVTRVVVEVMATVEVEDTATVAQEATGVGDQGMGGDATTNKYRYPMNLPSR